MSLLRAFIAVEIPPAIHKAIERKITPLKESLQSSLVRWVPLGKIHLTLKFLGDTSPTNMEMLTQMLRAEVSQHRSFQIQLYGLGTYPNPKRPHVIWIGIQAPGELAALQRGIEAATAKLGYPVEKRPFSPHLTIGRVKKNIDSSGAQKIKKTLENAKVGALGNIQITAVHLFKSDLKTTGAIYTRLHSAPLAKV